MGSSTADAKQSQYAAVTDGAGLVDRSQRGKIDLVGPDAIEYLQGQVTNDVAALQSGSGCYVALLNPKGRILGDARLLVRDPQQVWLDTEASALRTLLAELRTYKIGRDVEIADRSSERALLSLIGERSAEIASAATGGSVPPNEYESLDAQIAGHAAVIVRSALGLDLMLDAGAAPSAIEALIGAGAERVDEPIAELARIERGLPRFGLDMTADNLPGEAGIVERAISFTKGCYVGQEPVARMFHKGHPNRLLRGLRLTELVDSGATLLDDQRELGQIGSVADSPRHGPIALAIVRREAGPGDQLSIKGSGARATVIELPFDDR